MKLSEARPGMKVKIVELGGGFPALRRRLLDMGVLSGEPVIVERVAPLGDPVEVRIKGYWLSLRKQEAENILVEVLS